MNSIETRLFMHVVMQILSVEVRRAKCVFPHNKVQQEISNSLKIRAVKDNPGFLWVLRVLIYPRLNKLSPK